MNSVMTHFEKIFPIFFLGAALLSIAGCSKEAASPVTAPANTAPLVEQSAIDSPAAKGEEFRGSFAPRGIAATYRATFDGDQIKSLHETRTADKRSGEYEFLGARLMRYHGAALSSAEDLQLEFNQQGKVLVARAGAGTASDAEVTAIRDRAHSLRSHAVAQRAVRGHDKN